MWFKPWDDDVKNRCDNLRMEMRVELRNELEKLKADPSQMVGRVADLEVKMAKLWDLLTERTPRKQDKLSKFGRRFGGAGLN